MFIIFKMYLMASGSDGRKLMLWIFNLQHSPLEKDDRAWIKVERENDTILFICPIAIV